MQPRDIIAYLSDHYRGNWRKIYDHIVEQRPVPNEADHFADHYPCKIVTIMDDDYPKILQHCPKPPLALYYRGNLSLLNDESRCVAIIGSRAASDYGKRMAKSLGDGLAKKGCVVISGIARGIDGTALEAAFPFGKAVAILGNGVDRYYPSENADLQKRIEKDGLVLSEYPLGVEPSAEHFPNRNRIIASLSRMIVVAEAKPRSGTMITVAFAAEMGKDVGAVPFPADCETGCNRLIQDGAALITSADDVLFQMGRSTESPRIEEAE